MMLTWIYISLLCVQTVDRSQAACDQSEATQKCVMDFSTYINQAMSSVSDPSQMATVFCSAEGQSAIACMYPLMEQCPELIRGGVMPSLADMQNACSQMPSGVQTVDSSQAACDLSTLTSEATQNCFNGFSTYINQAMSSVSDPSQMATVFCS
ncbi:uncharacterized protein LOC128220076 [Mya arenaria]|uniref:uncharacterized protein LOC128220076 n=1 Tax=Mya arenaria TaxID=6604 RepID=UPI0022E560F1|nr:uncharacterized protein LOC128220076 [Mya arenaria]